MNIRIAKKEDLKVLHSYDKHISQQELVNSVQLNRVYIAEENSQFIYCLR